MAKLTREQFIQKIVPYAIEDMQRTNIPASLTIAQAILESADGNSDLAVSAHNLFGIKGRGTNGSYVLPTLEYIKGEPIKVNATFARYNNWGDSIRAHSNLFETGVSWNHNLYRGVIGKDGITAAKEVAKAGYATDPEYSSKLIKLIQQYNLQQYDKKELQPVQQTIDKRIDELEEIIKKIIIALTTVSDKLAEIPAPEWFVKEFPDSLHLVNNSTGTIDFWRSFAVALRICQK